MASRKLYQKRGIRDFFLSLKLNCDNFVASYIIFFKSILSNIVIFSQNYQNVTLMMFFGITIKKIVVSVQPLLSCLKRPLHHFAVTNTLSESRRFNYRRIGHSQTNVAKRENDGVLTNRHFLPNVQGTSSETEFREQGKKRLV